MERRPREIFVGPGGPPLGWLNAIFWLHCHWASSGKLRLENEMVVNFLRLCSGPRTWTRTFALRSWLAAPSLGLVAEIGLGYVAANG
jgi:hypothetical protein